LDDHLGPGHGALLRDHEPGGPDGCRDGPRGPAGRRFPGAVRKRLRPPRRATPRIAPLGQRRARPREVQRFLTRRLPVSQSVPADERVVGRSSRSDLGSGKWTFSSRIHSSWIVAPNLFCRYSMHSWTTSSGALAPAVIKTVLTPSNHSGQISATP